MSEKKGNTVKVTEGVLNATFFTYVLGLALHSKYKDIRLASIPYIDQRIEEDCESEQGQVAQVVGADEGQCDEGSSIRDLLALIRYPLLIAGIIFALLALQVF